MTPKKMSRKERRQYNRDCEKWPSYLSQIPEKDWPEQASQSDRIEVWRSNKYLAQIFAEKKDVIRISVNYVQIDSDGNWVEGLSWDELHAIKTEVGYGPFYAVEIFPHWTKVVNVANMRHLWVLPEPLDVGWGYGHEL